MKTSHTYTVLSLKTLQVKVKTRSYLRALQTYQSWSSRPNVRVAIWRDGIPMEVHS